MGITKVYIMTGSQIKLSSYKHSVFYINSIIKELVKYGLNIETKIGGKFDDNLLFSMNFDYFVPSEDRYCLLIKELNQKINPDFKII